MFHYKKLLYSTVIGTTIGVFPSTIAYGMNLHKNYAVLVSGGYDTPYNHLRYYEETLRMWNITTGLLNFDVDKVFVLFADGTDDAKDRTKGEIKTKNPANWVSSDWSAITNAGGNINAGTRGNLQNTLASLASIITPEDSFYFWSFNHGSNPSFKDCPNSAPNAINSPILNKPASGLCVPENPENSVDDVLLTAWNKESIRDDEFAAWVEPINAKAEVYAFAQCFSGGMVDDLFPAPNRFAAYAAASNECSFDRGWADAWADGLESGLRSTVELGQFAKINDPFGGGPALGKETPGWIGHNSHIGTDEEIKDFGDAPDSYKTLLGSDGPRYEEGVLQRLGFKWDGEPDGQPTPLANGDDLSILGKFAPVVDDEDGVIFGDTWVDVIFNITRPDPNPYQLRAWWDTNYNGMFDHTSELYIDDLLTLKPGIFTKRYNLGFNPKEDGLYSRFRLTWDPLDPDLKPFGEYYSKAYCNATDAAAGNCVSHGEVEDYVHVPEPSSLFGIFAISTLGAASALKRKQK